MGGVFLFQGRLNHAASARLHTGNLFLCNTRFNHLTAVLLKAVHQKKEGWGGISGGHLKVASSQFPLAHTGAAITGNKDFFC